MKKESDRIAALENTIARLERAVQGFVRPGTPLNPRHGVYDVVLDAALPAFDGSDISAAYVTASIYAKQGSAYVDTGANVEKVRDFFGRALPSGTKCKIHFFPDSTWQIVETATSGYWYGNISTAVNSTTTPIVWDEQQTSGAFTYSSGVLTCVVPGRYFAIAKSAVAVSNTGGGGSLNMYLDIQKNGSYVDAQGWWETSDVPKTTRNTIVATTLLNLAVGDTVEVDGTINAVTLTGSFLASTGPGAPSGTNFCVCKSG